MPQCKRDGCREEAQKYGKRLCPKHEAERKERSARYFAKPKCTYCGTQHTDRTCPSGQPECGTCRNERLEQESLKSDWLSKVEDLESCKTVNDLIWWIKKYNLPEKE